MAGTLSILIYHRVLTSYDRYRPDEVDIKRFDEQMGWVKRFFNVLDLGDAVNKLKTNSLPSRALAITFDDGYKDNYQNALPLLKKHGLTATFFVSTSFLNGGIMWNDVVIEALRNTSSPSLDMRHFGMGIYDLTDDRVAVFNQLIGEIKYLAFDERLTVIAEIEKMLGVESPNDLMMTAEEVRQLYRKGMAIGAHTENHPILAKLSRDNAVAEIDNGQSILKEITGNKISLFAYPNGKPHQDYTQEHVDIIRELGFIGGVSTAWGVARKESDLFQLPRFTPWDHSVLKFTMRLAKMRYASQEERV